MYIFISSLIFLFMVGPVYLKCNVPKKVGSFKDTKTVFDQFFVDHVLNDRCISKQNEDFFQFKKSEMIGWKSSDAFEFVHRFTTPNGTVTWRFTGTFKLVQSDSKYIAWEGVGEIPDVMKDVPKSGKIYFLDVHSTSTEANKYDPGSVLTYYTCFDDEAYINENIYITQLHYDDKKKFDAEKALKDAKDNLAKSDVTEKLKTMSCY